MIRNTRLETLLLMKKNNYSWYDTLSDNIIVRIIINIGLNGTHSIMGDNWDILGLNMEWKNIMWWNVGMRSIRMSVNLSEYTKRSNVAQLLNIYVQFNVLKKCFVLNVNVQYE